MQSYKNELDIKQYNSFYSRWQANDTNESYVISANG